MLAFLVPTKLIEKHLPCLPHDLLKFLLLALFLKSLLNFLTFNVSELVLELSKWSGRFFPPESLMRAGGRKTNHLFYFILFGLSFFF
jgi:hypothetical protein